MKDVYVFIDMYLEHMDTIFGICNVLERLDPAVLLGRPFSQGNLVTG